MIEAFRFYAPVWFIFAPLALAAVWWAYHPRRRAAAVFSSLADLKNLPVTMAQRVRRVLPYAYAVGLLLLIAALARPQSGKSESRINTEGIAIQLVIDISGSMEALDFEVKGKSENRLAAVKHVIRQFVFGSEESGLSGRRDDLVGLVAFGGYADGKCPLTLDHGALMDIVESLEIPRPIRDKRGNVINANTLNEDLATAIGDGVSLGLDRLRPVSAKSRVLILLTDGDNNAGAIDPREAAKIAKEMGVRVYTIGIGRSGEVPFPQEDAFGNRFLVPRYFKIDEELMREMAQTTGGKYFHAQDTKGLTAIYSEIDRMEKSKVEETKYTEYTELYAWFAVPGLCLVMGIAFLSATRFSSLP
ncbi:MAG TPA: VWA domain-containing protein [Planctomycetota bacterium]|nr:VWA domain-containing protein [Planctomycetota bacterium]